MLGGLIGAIAGKGKGASKGEQIQISPETKLGFTLKAPLTVTM